MSIVNSSVFVDGQSTITYVEGDQHNHVHTIINRISNSKEPTEYDEYENVTHGRVVILKEIFKKDDHWGYLGTEMKRLKASTTAYITEVYPDKQSQFTAVRYEGKDARRLWEGNFLQFSRRRDAASVQLFGINRSTVPMLIFHGDLVPLAHFCDGTTSLWKSVYITQLHWKLSKDPSGSRARCGFAHIWLDSRGIFRAGPAGPSPLVFHTSPDSNFEVPSTKNMLEGDASFDFFKQFASRCLDDSVLFCARSFTYLLLSCRGGYVSTIPPSQYELSMDTKRRLRFDNVYSHTMEAIARFPQHSRNMWYTDAASGFCNKMLVANGSTRFKVDVQGFKIFARKIGYPRIYSDQRELELAWLTQSSRVADALNMTNTEESQCLVLAGGVYVRFTCNNGLLPTLFKCNGEEVPLLYIFLRPPPMTLLEVARWKNEFWASYYWSFEETGQSRLSEYECAKWNLPLLYFSDDTVVPWQASAFDYPLHKNNTATLSFAKWPMHIYASLRKWQIARGFDPATADFAIHMDYPELEIVDAKRMNSRVQEGSEEKSEIPSREPESSWWEAIAGSGIPAFAL